jgi:glycosyltransferase involved in cell wall biosynthesis
VTSVVIAAHNEAAVIGRCLDALLADAAPGEFDITVVANGCQDDTVQVAAARPGVRVLDLPEPGKAAALNAGDAVARTFPRVYLDADIVLSTQGLRTIAVAVADGYAAAPRRRLDLHGRPVAVRGFFAINARLPVYRDGLFGRGVIALSERGRARFGDFPDLVADDLFLDSLFTSAEKRQVGSVTSTVATPRTTGDLVRRLSRVRAGNAAMRAAAAAGDAPSGVRASRRLSWLSDVVLPRPHLAPAAVCYVLITVAAQRRAARAARAGDTTWGRDESSRVASPTSSPGSTDG